MNEFCATNDCLEGKMTTRTLDDLRFDLQTWQQGTAVVVSVSGELDPTTAPRLCEAMDAAVDSGTGSWWRT